MTRRASRLGLPSCRPGRSRCAASRGASRSGRWRSAGTRPVSVQSMTTTRTSDIGATLQQIAELDRVGLPDRAGRLSHAGRRGRARHHRPQVADPGDRGHPLPAEVRVRGDRGRVCGGAGEPRQHQAVRRQGQGDRAGRHGRTGLRSGSGSTPVRWTGGCCRSTARRRRRRWSSRRCGRRRSSRSTASATSRSRSSTTTRS